MNTELYDLAYALRKSKIWKQIDEDEMFAVKLPGNEIGYCFIAGMAGQADPGFLVCPGTKGLSAVRRCFGEAADPLGRDCLMLAFRERSKLDEDEVMILRAYCKEKEIPFRAPFPRFARVHPYCVHDGNLSEDDEKNLETALRVTLKMAEQIKAEGKETLGLKPVALRMDGEMYRSYRSPTSGWKADEAVTVPLFTIENERLVQERMFLPPYVDSLESPETVDENILRKIMSGKQEGMFECDLTRSEILFEGDPAFYPPVCVATDEIGLMVFYYVGDGPDWDLNRILDEFCRTLAETALYPKVLCVRNRETKLLLEPLCHSAGIKLKVKKRLMYTDEAKREMLADAQNPDPEGNLKLVVTLLETMSVEEIRMMPDYILDPILESDELKLLPDHIVQKLKIARGKTGGE